MGRSFQRVTLGVMIASGGAFGKLPPIRDKRKIDGLLGLLNTI